LNSLVIRLSGHLSAELGSELYLKVKEICQSPSLFCLDGSSVTNLDVVGAEYLKKMEAKTKSTGSKIAFFGISPALQTQFIDLHISKLFPFFDSEIGAKKYLESQVLPTEPANEINVKPVNQTVTATVQTKTSLIYCPFCDHELRFYRIGDHLCPACENKFSVNQKGWTTPYEKLV